MARLVLSDASPLIVFARLDGLDWLRALFGTVCLPAMVRTEILDRGDWPGREALRAALAAGWLQVRDDAIAAPQLPDLDEGEAACIRLAIGHGEPVLILMDERAGRAVAAEHGLAVAGTAAVIGMAKQHGLIPSARVVFEALLKSDFRISRAAIQTVLERVGEAD